MISGQIHRAFMHLLVFVLSASLAVPAWAIGSVQRVTLPDGNYTVYQKTNYRDQLLEQIVVGPSSQEIFRDSRGRGVWDHWEFKKGSVRVVATNMVDGHFMRLDMQERLKEGVLELGFHYEHKTGMYRLHSHKLRNYYQLPYQDIVIGWGGTCGGVDSKTGLQTASLAEALQKIVDAASRSEGKEWSKVFEDLIANSPSFLDKSCKEGDFSGSTQAMIQGMAKVMGTSFRTAPDAKGGRFLQCMDQAGLGVHADRMREFFMTKLYTPETTEITQKLKSDLTAQKAGLSSAVSSSAPSTGAVGALAQSNLISGTDQDRASLNTKLAEVTTGLNATNNKLQELSKGINASIVCSYKPPGLNTINYGMFLENSDQIAIYRTAGELINDKAFSAEDYAQTFFHEMVHASLIEIEPYALAISDCCSIPTGYDPNNKACQDMDKITAEQKVLRDAEDSFMVDPQLNDGYWEFYSALAADVGAEKSNEIMSNFFKAFEDTQDQCSGGGAYCPDSVKISSREKLNQDLVSCMQSGKLSPEDCKKAFNKGYAENSLWRFQKVCEQTLNGGSQASQCADYAKRYVRIFGSCGAEKAAQLDLKEFWTQQGLKFAALLLFGADAQATSAEEICKCWSFDSALGQEINKNAPREAEMSQADLALSNPNRAAFAGAGARLVGPSTVDSENTYNNVNHNTPIPVGAATGGGKVVSSETLARPYAETHEKRSARIADSAMKALNAFKIDTAQARESVKNESSRNRGTFASTGSQYASSRNPASLSEKPVRISDPFKETSVQSAGTGIGVTMQSSGASSSAAPSRAFASAQSNSQVSDKPNVGVKTADTSNTSSSATSKVNLKMAHGTSGVGGVGGLSFGGPGAAAASHKSSASTHEFESAEDLIRYLTGSYVEVQKRLSDVHLRKAMIDFKIQVMDHAGQIHGSRSPEHRLEFSPDKKALVVIQGM